MSIFYFKPNKLKNPVHKFSFVLNLTNQIYELTKNKFPQYLPRNKLGELKFIVNTDREQDS